MFSKVLDNRFLHNKLNFLFNLLIKKWITNKNGIKKKDIHAWPYGRYNAAMYIRYVLDFDSNLELLLGCECEDFDCELDLHEWIFRLEDLPTLEDKINRFYRLKISKSTIKESLASALLYSLENKNLTGLKSWVEIIVENHMPFICNDTYCDTIIEVYALFDVFNLYPEKCIRGFIGYFSNTYSSYDSVEKKACLNSLGLIKFLNLIKIKSEPLSEIISLCNYLESSTPFISYLRRYSKSNYDVFANQSLYDQLFTTVHSCSYSDLEIFFEKKILLLIVFI